jgi:hypothetical protein
MCFDMNITQSDIFKYLKGPNDRTLWALCLTDWFCLESKDHIRG